MTKQTSLFAAVAAALNVVQGARQTKPPFRTTFGGVCICGANESCDESHSVDCISQLEKLPTRVPLKLETLQHSWAMGYQGLAVDAPFESPAMGVAYCMGRDLRIRLAGVEKLPAPASITGTPVPA